MIDKVEIQIASKVESRSVFTLKEFTTKEKKERAKLTADLTSETTDGLLDILDLVGVDIGAKPTEVLSEIQALSDLGVEVWRCDWYPGEPVPWVIWWRHPNDRGMTNDASATTVMGMFHAASVSEAKRQRNAKLYEAQRHLAHARAALHEMGLDDLLDLISKTMEKVR